MILCCWLWNFVHSSALSWQYINTSLNWSFHVSTLRSASLPEGQLRLDKVSEMLFLSSGQACPEKPVAPESVEHGAPTCPPRVQLDLGTFLAGPCPGAQWQKKTKPIWLSPVSCNFFFENTKAPLFRFCPPPLFRIDLASRFALRQRKN